MAQASNVGSGLFRQVIVVALPGFGAGAQADAAAYRDRGASTLTHVSAYVGGVELGNLAWLGLGNVTAVRGVAPASPPAASFGRVARVGEGRDAAGALRELVGGAVDALIAANVPVQVIGGAVDVFGRMGGVAAHAVAPREVLLDVVTRVMRREPLGLIVASPDPERGLSGAGPVGVARALARFDGGLTALIDQLSEESLLILCGVGGNDATIAARDGATRECGPVLVYAQAVPSGVELGTRLTFADVGATAAEVFGAAENTPGRSFLGDMLV